MYENKCNTTRVACFLKGDSSNIGKFSLQLGICGYQYILPDTVDLDLFVLL